MKRCITVLLAVMMLLSVFFIVPSYAATQLPAIEGEAFLVMDMTTGKILTSQNADEKMYPASTTKMITAILALENLDMNHVITVSSNAADTKGTILGLKTGEQLTVKNILYAMMVKSANDCAVALAEEMAGNIESFAVMMNQKAAEIGCTSTNFVTPNGLHDENHYSTASDLAKIALYCMQNETFRDIVQTIEYSVPATNVSPEIRTVKNTNLLLYDEDDANRIYVNNELRYCKYDGCIGIKTGQTPEAQGCLVAAAEKHGTKILTVVLKSSTYGRFADSIKLLDWGFTNYRTLTVMTAGKDMGEIKVKKGEFNKVGTELSETLIFTIPSEASDAIITPEIQLEEELIAPVSKGAVVGHVVISEGGKKLGTYDIVASEDIKEGGVLSNFYIEDATAKKILISIIGVFVFLILLLVIYVLLKRREIRIKKERRAAKLKAKLEEEQRRKALWERQYDDKYRQHYHDDIDY